MLHDLITNWVLIIALLRMAVSPVSEITGGFGTG